jgi:ubiquinone/menaquinone biosynthesis C-methylase UbiE
MNNPSTNDPSFDSPGDGAFHYDHFLGPLFFEPYAIEIAKRIDPSSVSIALEIAAGTGRVTRHIRESIAASAKLIASDISEEMLAEAKNKLSHSDIDWQHIDAQRLPFNDNSIDLVVCCFGYMFVPDKQKAFAEAYRVLRPGGMFLFTTWDKLEHNAVSYTSRLLAEKYMKGPLPDSYNVAVSMNDENAISALLKETGFSKIFIEKVQQFSVCATAKEAATGLVEGGFVFKEIRHRNPEWIDEIKIKLEKELSEKFGAAPMIAPMSAVICQAGK